MLKKITGSSLFRSAGLYTVANIINSAIPFLLMPILTRYLTPRDYGILAMFQVLIGFIFPFVGINVQGAVSVKYFKKDEIDFPRYVSSCFLILLSSCLFMSVVFAVGYIQIGQMTAIPVNWLWAVIVLCLGQFVVAMLLVILQSSVQPFSYGMIQIAQSVMNLLLTLFLVVWLQYNWEGRIIAQLVTGVGFAVFSVLMLYRRGWLLFGYDNEYIIDALKFGIPLLPHALAGFVMTMTDRMIIAHFVGISEAGIYTVGVQIGMVIGMLESSFIQAWVPWFYKTLNNITKERKARIVRFTYLYDLGLILFAVTLALTAPFILKWFVGEKFQAAAQYILWIGLGAAIGGMYKMVAGYIFYMEKTSLLAGVTFITACLHVPITYSFVHFYGPIGAAQANVVSLLVKLLLTWILSNRVYPMPWITTNLFNRRNFNGKNV